MADTAAAAAAAAAAALGPSPGIPIPGPGGPGGIPIPIPGAPVPIRPFALTPALLEGRYLNSSSQPDVKLHYKAIRPLTVKFDLTPGNMVEFCNDFMARAKDVNWLMTLTILVGVLHYNLITQYGSVMLEQVRGFVTTYAGTPSRHAQNANQIYACLNKSLTSEAKNKVRLEMVSYSINNDFDGLLYFKVIVGLAHI
jgi:hypothetical protein